MQLRKAFRSTATSVLAMTLFASISPAWSDSFQVKVTNITAGQTFTPRIAITHSAGNAFALGETAISEVAAIAESGNVGPMMDLLKADGIAQFITATFVSPESMALLEPGKSETFTIEGNAGDTFTLLNMLIPTNDAFIGINAVALPTQGSVKYRGVVYDAGVETNDESCANIPGPVCEGAGPSADDSGEGFIHVHPGIHGVADLNPAERDWRNPAVMVMITKM